MLRLSRGLDRRCGKPDCARSFSRAHAAFISVRSTDAAERRARDNNGSDRRMYRLTRRISLAGAPVDALVQAVRAARVDTKSPSSHDDAADMVIPKR